MPFYFLKKTLSNIILVDFKDFLLPFGSFRYGIAAILSFLSILKYWQMEDHTLCFLVFEATITNRNKSNLPIKRNKKYRRTIKPNVQKTFHAQTFNTLPSWCAKLY